MRYDLTTIGEGQIRLTCERGDRLATARSLRMTAAGSEANVARAPVRARPRHRLDHQACPAVSWPTASPWSTPPSAWT